MLQETYKLNIKQKEYLESAEKYSLISNFFIMQMELTIQHISRQLAQKVNIGKPMLRYAVYSTTYMQYN